jgi:hypothetical protein
MGYIVAAGYGEDWSVSIICIYMFCISLAEGVISLHYCRRSFQSSSTATSLPLDGNPYAGTLLFPHLFIYDCR